MAHTAAQAGARAAGTVGLLIGLVVLLALAGTPLGGPPEVLGTPTYTATPTPTFTPTLTPTPTWTPTPTLTPTITPTPSRTPTPTPTPTIPTPTPLPPSAHLLLEKPIKTYRP